MSKMFVSNKKETPRIFENNFLEFFSRVHPVVPLIIYLPLISYMFYLGISENLNYSDLILFFAGGYLFWHFTEYIIHRFIFHYEPKSEFGKKLHFIIHGVHHDYPSDPLRLVMPPSVSLPLAGVFFILFQKIIGIPAAYIFFAGFLFGYLAYDMTHYAIHNFAIKNNLWRKIKEHHMKHHFNDPQKGFAISLPAFDKLFGTYSKNINREG
ncbi:MAG: sterol desaturase family protein [Ignavibacteriaceae bacterium]|nr:sterol desaturase family protein [Ignavibacteriaceae bacterium]